MTQATATESAPRLRRWFRFSLRSMLIFTTLIGAGLAWVGKERMQSWREAQFAKEHPTWDIQWQPPAPESHEHWRYRLANFVLGPRIIEVLVGDPKFSDLTPLAGLKNLQTLWLESTQVTDLTPMAGLKNLQTLSLDFTQVSDLTPLVGLKNLQTLVITSTQVKDITPLEELTNLRRLDLGSTQVSDITPLAGLTNLQSLELASTQVTDEQVKWLQAKLPNCNIVQ